MSITKGMPFTIKIHTNRPESVPEYTLAILPKYDHYTPDVKPIDPEKLAEELYNKITSKYAIVNHSSTIPFLASRTNIIALIVRAISEYMEAQHESK